MEEPVKAQGMKTLFKDLRESQLESRAQRLGVFQEMQILPPSQDPGSRKEGEVKEALGL